MASASAYAVEPASTGTASIPVPMMPSAKSRLAKRPATGASALAACAAVCTVVTPATCKVDADDTMMANMTKTAEAIPAATSPRIACT